ncbi:uncharacterized protein LOC104452055 [Eucalyptus grandis]|uniref:uncharacterized protein LOC104452055 n=1 Tax=Eucalyptus grandis TaxID=71139 RepID=UPI00192E7D6B|nr:uncharacterized protein LOC104452055 [Eucalyptus grandis]
MLILAQKMRACYSESLEYLRDGSYNNDDFVEMMVIDGCFVVELLRLYYDLFHTKSIVEAIEDDPIFTKPVILTSL